MGDSVSGSGVPPKKDYNISDIAAMLPYQGNVQVQQNNDSLESSTGVAQVSGPDAKIPVLAKMMGAIIAAQKNVIDNFFNAWFKAIDEINKSAEKKQEEIQLEKVQEKSRDLHSPEKIADRDREAAILKKASAPDDSAFISSNFTPGVITPQVQQVWQAGMLSYLANQGAVNPADVQKVAGAGTSLVEGATPLAGITGVGSLELLTPSVFAAAVALPLFLSAAPPASTINQDFAVLRNGWGALNPGNDQTVTQIGGWFSSMVGVATSIQVTATNVAKAATQQSQNRSGAENNLQFAKQYANTILKGLSGPSFDTALGAMVKGAANAQKITLSAIDLAQMQAKGKILLLSSALALLIKTDTGWLSGQDFTGFVNGTTTFKPDPNNPNFNMDPNHIQDTAESLVSAINSQLALLGPNIGGNLIKRIADAFNGNPSVENLLDTNSLLASQNEVPADAKLAAQGA